MLKYLGILVAVALYATVTPWALLILLVVLAHSYGTTSAKRARTTGPQR